MNKPITYLASLSAIAAGVAIFIAQGCGGDKANALDGTLTGTISIDGSSTVEPITSAVAEEFLKEAPSVKVPVGVSGTSGGFKKFINGEIVICNASRPITAEEIAAAKEKGLEYIEIPVAFDGLSVVVHKDNAFVDKLTVDELKKIWEPSSKINNWKDVRPGFPDLPLKLFGAGHDSGTFDYFTEAVVGKKGSSREDYQPSEDDNVLVQGVAGEKGSLGYFGYAYYEQNQDKLKIVPIDPGTGAVTPSPETIKGGAYTPLSRPLFIYVRKDAADKPEVKAFVKFYLEKAIELVASANYVPLTEEIYKLCQARFDAGTVGTVFGGTPQVGVKLEDLLSKEK